MVPQALNSGSFNALFGALKLFLDALEVPKTHISHLNTFIHPAIYFYPPLSDRFLLKNSYNEANSNCNHEKKKSFS